jgi:hypothetical protein
MKVQYKYERELKDTIKIMKAQFHPLISRTRDAFRRMKTVFDYFTKLISDQGISFLIGIAVGINLILLIQMSEDIFNKLSEPITGSILGIAGIISIVIVGVTILYMQKKSDQRLSKFIEEQLRLNKRFLNPT